MPADLPREPLVVARDLRKMYSQPDGEPIVVLSGAGFTLKTGGSLAVTGQSGSGKSTLLALLAGLDRPDGGSIVIAGVELGGLDPSRLTRFRAEHIAMVFQQFHLLGHLSAEENVRLPLELLGRKVDGQAVTALLDRVGLKDRRHHLPGQLSGGECQRVALARALAVRPLLLLADEPTGNLDPATGREVSELLFSLAAREGMTLIVVTHNQELADRCDRRLCLAGGALR